MVASVVHIGFHADLFIYTHKNNKLLTLHSYTNACLWFGFLTKIL